MEKDSNGNPVFTGYCMELLQMISENLNFSYEVSVAPDGEFGNLNENGEWNGMIRELMDKVRELMNI